MKSYPTKAAAGAETDRLSYALLPTLKEEEKEETEEKEEEEEKKKGSLSRQRLP